MTETETRLRTLVAEMLHIEPDAIDPTSSFKDDLGADSFDIVDLIMKVEDEFGITIGEHEDDALIDGAFSDLVTLVEGKMAKAQAA